MNSLRKGWVAIGILGIAIGYVVSRNSMLPLGLMWITLVLGVVVLEILRRTMATDLPWWIPYVAVIPWTMLVIVPWTYRAVTGSWTVVGSPIDLDLPHTWSFHLLAGAGFIAGTIAALVGRQKKATGAVVKPNWLRASVLLGALVGTHFLNLIIAKRPLSALWALSGEREYSVDPAQATPIAILDNVMFVASGVFLVVVAARRRRHPQPGRVELSWLFVLSLLSFGSGARGRFYLVALGWAILQFGPALRRRVGGSRAKRMFGFALTGIVAIASLSLGAKIADVRNRAQRTGSFGEQAALEFDVIGSGELLFQRGATPGMLAGQSYSELPVLFLPRRLVGESKPRPAADLLVRRLVADGGFAAPLWIESALNFGRTGVIVFSFAYAFLFIWLLRRSLASKGRFQSSIGLLGPLWLFLSFYLLCRLVLLVPISIAGPLVVGIYLGSRCLTSPATAEPLAPLAEVGTGRGRQGVMA